MCVFKVDEIGNRSQFHQHFTRAFFVQNFGTKNPKHNVIREKLLNSLSYEKRAFKMLMKLTPAKYVTFNQGF
jgi:hypothetical protein